MHFVNNLQDCNCYAGAFKKVKKFKNKIQINQAIIIRELLRAMTERVTLGQHQTPEIESVPSLSHSIDSLFTPKSYKFITCVKA